MEVVNNKKNGLWRTDPMSSLTTIQAKAANNETNTLCHICSLRYQNRDKLMTHMKNHTGQSHIYNMYSMQEAIKESNSTEATANIIPRVIEKKTKQNNSLQQNINSRKCDNTFENMEEIKKHMRNDNKTYRPCKNYSAETWASLTPKHISHNSLIKKIIVSSFYYRGPHSKIKTILLDHISQTFHLLTAKYGDGIHFIICGDSNRLDLSSILSLSSSMRQLVTFSTRGQMILDPIISTLGLWYQKPVCLPGLQSDPGTGGARSDHLIPTMRPIDVINNKPAREIRKMKIRPLPDSIQNLIKRHLEGHDWSNVYSAETANEKVDTFKRDVMEIVNNVAPEKSRNIASDDKQWFTEPLKNLDRKRRREFNINRRSKRYFRHGQTNERVRSIKVVFPLKENIQL